MAEIVLKTALHATIFLLTGLNETFDFFSITYPITEPIRKRKKVICIPEIFESCTTYFANTDEVAKQNSAINMKIAPLSRALL